MGLLDPPALTRAAADTAYGLAPTPTKTAAYTVAPGELALMNVPAGGAALTLPPAPPDKTRVGVRAIGATTAVPLVLTAGGSDTIGDAGATTVSQPLAGEVTVLQYQAAATRWLAVANVKSMTSLDARYPVVPASGKLSASQLDTAGIAASSDLNGTYGRTPANRASAYADGGPGIPTITKLAANPILTKTATGLRSIYVPCLIRVPDAVRAAAPTLGKWRIYYSTDHDSTSGQVGMAYCNAENPDDAGATWTVWTGTGGTTVLFTEGGNTQTETPCVVWNPRTSLFHMYYQVQTGGANNLQRTKVATSPDGITWTVVGIAFPNFSSTVAGYDHTGYAKVWRVDGLWVGWTLQGGGTAVSAEGVWYSYDGLTFLRDPRRSRGNLQWSEGTLRTAVSAVLAWRGQYWATSSSVNFTSGANPTTTIQNWVAPLNPDFRSLRGRPQYVPFAQEGIEEGTRIPEFWSAAPDGRLWGAYRSGGAVGTINLAVAA